MDRIREWSNEDYILKVYVEKGVGKGSLLNKKTGLSKDLSRIISDERYDIAYPSEVSYALHKFLDELRIDANTFKVR